jgi:hypothetical protein
MAAHGAAVLRPRICLQCETLFWLCSHCDRGQRYCSLACRAVARSTQRRRANRRHQCSPEGRLDHRDRQRQYRQRRAQAGVTDQGSVSVISPALSQSGEAIAEAAVVRSRNVLVRMPRWPEAEAGFRRRCSVCAATGRFIDPFPLIPRRR